MAQETQLKSPPYVAFRTFSNFLDWLKEAGVPGRIDRSFWGDRLSGAYGSQLMAALRFLDLIDEDSHPDPDLELMANDVEVRKRTLRARLEANYGGALDGLSLETATLGQLQERFKVFPVSGETLRKALKFYVHAAQYAEVPLSTHITKKTRITSGPRPRRAKPKPDGGTKNKEDERESPPPPPAPERGLHPSVEALLGDLAKVAPGWTSDQRDTWVSTFKTVIDYAYPTSGGDSQG